MLFGKSPFPSAGSNRPNIGSRRRFPLRGITGGISIRIDGGLILSGLPEGWAEAKFIDPAWAENQHDAVVSRMEGNAREGSRNRHL